VSIRPGGLLDLGAGVENASIDYDYLTQRALRSVLREVLQMTARSGRAPGDHHFYIEFETKAEGVEIPQFLVESYPQRMTIVLQHQFQDLDIEEDSFAVTLWFKGRQARLNVPFYAVTSFADPSVQFGLRFDAAAAPRKTDLAKPEKDAEETTAASNAAVVQLDAFRKK
jgi:hypothetical protein